MNKNNFLMMLVLIPCHVLHSASTPPVLYVARNGGAAVLPVDITTNTAGSSIVSVLVNYSIPFTPDGSKAYLVTTAANTIRIVDVASNTVIGTVTGTFNAPKQKVISPDGLTGYVTNNGNGLVSVINIATGAVDHTINVGGSPDHLAISPDGSTLYVGRGTLTKIALPSETITANVAGISNITWIAFTPDSSQAYIDDTTAQIKIVNVATGTLVTTLLSPSGEIDQIVFTPSGDAAYVANSSGNRVLRIDTTLLTTTTVTDLLSSVTLPLTLAITPDGDTLYVGNFASNAGVAIVDVASNNVTGRVTGASVGQIVALGIKPPDRAPTQVIQAPINVLACKTQNVFLMDTDLINLITWDPPLAGTAPVSYLIYRDAALTDLAGTVSASEPLEFEDHNRVPGITYTYYIVSRDGSGNVSTSVSSGPVTRQC